MVDQLGASELFWIEEFVVESGLSLVGKGESKKRRGTTRKSEGTQKDLAKKGTNRRFIGRGGGDTIRNPWIGEREGKGGQRKGRKSMKGGGGRGEGGQYMKEEV